MAGEYPAPPAHHDPGDHVRRRGTTIRRASAAIAACALALTACQSGQGSTQTGPPPEIGGGDIDATPPASDEPTEPTAAGEDWTPPDPLTEEYLLRVLTSLEADLAIFDRWLIESEANEEPPPSAREAVVRVFVPGFVENYIDTYVIDHAKDPDAPGAKRPYGQYRPTSVELLRSDVACPFIVVTWDSSEVASAEGRERRPDVIALVRSSTHDVKNESGWLIRAIKKQHNVPAEDVQKELDERSLCP